MKVVVIGGGPSGSIAATTLAKAGVETYLIEKNLSGSKPCGGGIPSGVLNEFEISPDLFERKVSRVATIAPSGLEVITDLRKGFIGMVDRGRFDSSLRKSASEHGANVIEGVCKSISFSGKDSTPLVTVKNSDGEKEISADFAIGADGADSVVARYVGAKRPPLLMMVQEKIELKGEALAYYDNRCEFWYGKEISPNFYGWVFPKGEFVTLGTAAPYGQAKLLNECFGRFKEKVGCFKDAPVINKEEFPLPYGPVKKKVFGKVLLAGDAAGAVMPVSGEGIYCGMVSGLLAAEALIKGDPSYYEREWDKRMGHLFRLHNLVGWLFYRNDTWRELLVRMHRDADAQERSLELWLYKNSAYPVGSIYWKMLRGFFRHV